jgi:hypothetical protein
MSKPRKKLSTEVALTPEQIERSIQTVRGHSVLMDVELAKLYGVTTGALNQAVRRNSERFPEDFAFQLTSHEMTNLKSQNVISSWGGRRTAP